MTIKQELKELAKRHEDKEAVRLALLDLAHEIMIAQDEEADAQMDAREGAMPPYIEPEE